MKKLWNGRRALALLLTLVMLTTALPLTALAEEIAPPEAQAEQVAPPEAQAGSFADSLGDGSTAYFEVRFALPEGASTQEVEYTTLPETDMVP